MNLAFTEHVTGIAFSLQLSKQMCEALQYVMKDRYSPVEQGSFRVFEYPPNMTTMHALERRGILIQTRYAPGSSRDETKVQRSVWRVTAEGEKVFELLVMANLCDAIGRKAEAA